MQKYRWAGVSILAVLAGSVEAQTSYPMLTHVTPVAVQRGRTSEILVHGVNNLADVYRVVCEGAGLEAEVVPDPKPAAGVRTVKLKVKVQPDAAPGVREFRLVCNHGVSSIGQLVVTEHPVIEEKGDNNTREKANPLPVPGVAAGRIEVAEDVDCYKFKGRAGQTYTFEVLCARLQDKIHDLQKHADPILTLYDAEGRELAANDDFYFADPLLTWTCKQDGEYVIQVRDSRYDGDPRWVYALLATDQPHATHVYPMAGNPGQVVEVEPIGSAGRAAARVRVRLPDRPGLVQVPLDLGGGKTSNPVTFLVSELPQVLEQEPNDTPEQAHRIAIPCGINGRIGTPGDRDHFRFQGTKGKAFRFEVKARRFGTLLLSSLDSVLEILDAKGTVLASNDDSFGKDSALVFTPTADGEYVLRLRDLNSKGGPTFVYYLEADRALPDFTLVCEGDKAMIGPGGRAAWYVKVTRLNGFTGPVQVEVQGLPAGVSVQPLTIPAGMNQGLLVLSAAPGAVRGAANVEVVGTGRRKNEGREEAVVRKAGPVQEIYFPGGGRGLFPVNLHTVAVTEPMDILEVAVTPSEIVLKPGQEVRLEVTVKRKPGFDKPVSLDVLLRHLGQVFGDPLPPGVTLVEGKSKTLLGTGSQGYIVLRAAPNAAEAEGVPISVLCHVSINFVVKVSYSSAPIRVSVRK
jgi:hypothetical protein